MGLLLCDHLTNLTTYALGSALQSHLILLRSRSFTIGQCFVDQQTGIAALKGQLAGVEIDICGAGDHNASVDVRIRHIKEVARAVMSKLPWKLAHSEVKALVYYSVSRLNLRRKSSSNNSSPRVEFTGMKPCYRKELSIGFGDYVECYNPAVVSRDIRDERTEPCIALYPNANATGTWTFLNLNTGYLVQRSRWKKMITTDLIISRMNERAAGHAATEESTTTQESVAKQTTTTDAQNIHTVVDSDVTTNDQQQQDHIESSEPEVEIDEDQQPTVQLNTEPVLSDESHYEERVVGEHSLRSGRTIAGVRHRVQKRTRPHPAVLYTCYRTSVIKALREHGDHAYRAIVAELKQLLRDKKALAPRHRGDLSARQLKSVIRSFMFLKTKFDALGNFDKLKARLVGDGASQDKTLYDNISSPTVALQSVMMCLCIAAREGRKIAAIDIGGAYLNAEMTGEEVYMELEPMLARLLAKECPEVKPYLDERGKLICKLDRALYGCVQSAKLWYDTLVEFLKSLNFVQNVVDACVFNRTESDGTQTTLLLFVDDLLVLSSASGISEELSYQLKQRFGYVKLNTDADISYLGMHIVMKNNRAVISMISFLDDLLNEVHVKCVRTTRPLIKYSTLRQTVHH